MEHILIAEQDSTLGRALAAARRAYRFEAEVARGARQALAIVGSDVSWDAVIVGARLARGLELVHRLRSFHGIETALLLLLATVEDALYRIAAIERGADYFLQKPVDVREVVACLR